MSRYLIGNLEPSAGALPLLERRTPESLEECLRPVPDPESQGLTARLPLSPERSIVVLKAALSVYAPPPAEAPESCAGSPEQRNPEPAAAPQARFQRQTHSAA